jgi:outer membrane protein OmpA-like peptidoglycan-associated protein
MNKNTFLKLLFVMLVLTSTAHAENAKNTVETENHTYVMDSSGNCVRTQWMSPDDKCSDQKITEEIDISKVEERVVLFDFDKYDIRPQAKERLNTLIDIFKHNKITHIKIVGYADPIGRTDYNKRLSENRANSVNSYLNEHMHLDSSIIQLKAMGSTNQFADCKMGKLTPELKECLQPNRRVEVEIDYNFHDKKTVVIPWKEKMYHPEKYTQ